MNVAELLRVAEENLAFDAAEEAERDRKDEDRVKKCGLLKKVCLMILPKQCLWFCFGSCFMLNSSAVNERPPPPIHSVVRCNLSPSAWSVHHHSTQGLHHVAAVF